MADNDAAFLWETEALRASTPRPMPQSVGSNGESVDTDWVTLRQANEITKIPIKTLRKWARREDIASHLEEADGKQLRMVSLTSIEERARQTGRREEPMGSSTPPRSGKTSVDTPPESVEPPESEQPPGTMLVPIDAWDKMLLQLGNLHQAGQQLAEARERAAKAETEAHFLKERLTEIRSELAERRTPSPDQVETVEVETVEVEPTIEVAIAGDDNEILVKDLGPSPETDDEGKTVTAYSLEMMKHVYSTWRGRPRR